VLLLYGMDTPNFINLVYVKGWNKMGKINFICLWCRESFTRKFSANRHNASQHDGKGQISRAGDDLMSRKQVGALSENTGFPTSVNSLRAQKRNQTNKYEDRPKENHRPIPTDGRQKHMSYEGSVAHPASHAVNPAVENSDVTFLRKFNLILELKGLLSLIASPQEAKDLLCVAYEIENVDYLNEMLVGFRNIARTRRPSWSYDFYNS
jgi:hypothetical protein